MPYNDPMSYLMPVPGMIDMNAMASLVGLQPTAMSAAASNMVRQGMAPLQPAGPPGLDMYAAPVKGHSLRKFMGTSDSMIQDYIESPKQPKRRADAIKEYNIRSKHGTWGVPGAKPVDPQIG